MAAAPACRYQAIELLGRGGMGAVYRAHDAVRGHVVALKWLTVSADTKHREERIALFHGEYRTLAELKHPRAIDVFDYGLDTEGPYYTMELLDGADLSRKAPVEWRQACSLARDVCSSLALLHSRGYVHRDVSPLNVLRRAFAGSIADLGVVRGSHGDRAHLHRYHGEHPHTAKRPRALARNVRSHRASATRSRSQRIEEQLDTVTGDEVPELATTLSLHSVRPVLLTCIRDNRVATVGVVALRSEQPVAIRAFYAATRELSNALIDWGDVKPRFG